MQKNGLTFLCRPDIAKKNFEYITYATPNKGAYELLDEELKQNKALFPDLSALTNCEIIQYPAKKPTPFITSSGKRSRQTDGLLRLSHLRVY